MHDKTMRLATLWLTEKGGGGALKVTFFFLILKKYDDYDYVGDKQH